MSDERLEYSKSSSLDVEILESAKIQQLKCTGADQTSTHKAAASVPESASQKGWKKRGKKRKNKTANSASPVSQTTGCDPPSSSNGISPTLLTTDRGTETPSSANNSVNTPSSPERQPAKGKKVVVIAGDSLVKKTSWEKKWVRRT